MERADGALYASKRSGRNRTSLADMGSEAIRAA
jgi:PleD family two-component response regulator